MIPVLYQVPMTEQDLSLVEVMDLGSGDGVTDFS